MIKSKQTYVDKHGNYYLVCDPIVDGLHEFFIVNLKESVCTRLTEKRAEQFLSGMQETNLEVEERDKND